MKKLILTVALLGAAPAQAAVADVGTSGMEIQHTIHVAAAPQKVWDVLIQPARYWSPDHTFSGKAANMTLEPKAGGCWCEALPNGGSVQHMAVGFFAPPKTLVLRGSLGPFFNLGADGALAWTLAAKDAGTDVTLTFRAGGYVKDGFGKWAAPVDQVLGEQIAHLRQAAETKP
ncbi:MAG: SRPBCC domain-containing protein [Rhodospirillaceae bacterium]|nr:SRPBCC domain-containing protein [Rhodospirillaceae bacterium]